MNTPAFLVIFTGLCSLCFGQTPARQRGYALRGTRASVVAVELCYDLLCVDCQANWAITRRLIDLNTFSEEQFGLQLTPFPLPYHHHSFLVTTGFRAYMALSVAKTRQQRVECLDSIFYNQEYFLVTEAQAGEKTLESDIVKFFLDHCDVNLEHVFSNQTLFREYNMQARFDWKYVASRGVYGTPSIIINGFISDDAGDYSFDQWAELIKNLLAGKDEGSMKQVPDRRHSWTEL